MNDSTDMGDPGEPNDAGWTDDGGAPKKKRRIPKWLLFGCGCGCLFVVAAGGLIGYFIMQAADPDVQWPKLQKQLAFDERPSDLELQFGMPIPGANFEMFTMVDEVDKYVATVQIFGSLSSSDAEALFSENPGQVPGGFGEPTGAHLGEVEIQGRVVRALHYTGIKGTGAIDPVGSGVRIDISGDEPGIRMVDLRTLNQEGPVTDEQIDDFFGHFDVWRNH